MHRELRTSITCATVDLRARSGILRIGRERQNITHNPLVAGSSPARPTKGSCRSGPVLRILILACPARRTARVSTASAYPDEKARRSRRTLTGPRLCVGVGGLHNLSRLDYGLRRSGPVWFLACPMNGVVSWQHKVVPYVPWK